MKGCRKQEQGRKRHPAEGIELVLSCCWVFLALPQTELAGAGKKACGATLKRKQEAGTGKKKACSRLNRGLLELLLGLTAPTGVLLLPPTPVLELLLGLTATKGELLLVLPQTEQAGPGKGSRKQEQ